MRLKLLIAICALILSGCLPEENPVIPYARGGIIRSEVALGSDYGIQSYFNLETQEIIKSNAITAWDIAFESSNTTHHIILNTGRAMAIVNAGQVNFDSIFSSAQTEWKYDTPDGSMETTAFGFWWVNEDGSIRSKEEVFLVNLGYDEKAKHLGYRKLTILSYDSGVYKIKYAGLKGENVNELEIRKDPTCSFTYASLINSSSVDIEPPQSTEWDIFFTRYTYLFYNPSLTPYLVTGVLLNPGNTMVAIDSTRNFAGITSNHTNQYTFAATRDQIGYDWKYYDLEQGVYTVNSSRTYILKTSTGFYYKLRFIDFYDQFGEKGTISFEFQKL